MTSRNSMVANAIEAARARNGGAPKWRLRDKINAAIYDAGEGLKNAKTALLISRDAEEAESLFKQACERFKIAIPLLEHAIQVMGRQL